MNALCLAGWLRMVCCPPGGTSANPTYDEVCMGFTGHAEVVQVTYDPDQVSHVPGYVVISLLPACNQGLNTETSSTPAVEYQHSSSYGSSSANCGPAQQ